MGFFKHSWKGRTKSAETDKFPSKNHILDLETLALLKGSGFPTLLKKDLLKLQTNYFSHALFLPGRKTTILDITANSGAFAFHFAKLSDKIEVIAVETRNKLYQRLKSAVEKSGRKNIHCYRSIDEALERAASIASDGKTHIHLLKIGRTAFDLALLRRIAEKFQVGHLCGEFHGNDNDALAVYRLSAEMATSFFWQNLTRENWLSGYGGSDFEVSIVVPVYNVSKYLPICLKSLVNQTLKRKEILLVDDGSTDDSGRIADRWRDHYPFIRVIHQPNAGCAAARSTGMAAARGQFVGFVDSDDWVEPEMYENLYKAAVVYNSEVAQCGFRKVYDDSQTVEPFEEGFLFGTDAPKCRLIETVTDIMVIQPSIWRRIYRMDFMKAKGIDFLRTLPRFDDLPFQFEVFMHLPRMVAIPDIYYNYRLERRGQDVAANDERLFIHFEIFRYLREKLDQNPKLELEIQLKRVELNTHEWALSKILPHLKRRYMAMAAIDIVRNRLMISRTTLIWDALRHSPKRGLKVLAAMVYDKITSDNSK